MMAAESMTAYLARRGVAPQWRGFLRGLVETLDTHLDAESRNALMRAVGGRIAAAAPLPHCATLLELETRINDVLASMEWGFVELALEPATRSLRLTHRAAPAVAVATDADGAWITAVLEGLYGAWLAEQPGANPGIALRVTRVVPGEAVLTYAKA